MTRAHAARLGYRITRRRRPRATLLGARVHARRRALRAFRAVPLAVQLFVGVAAIVVLWYAANWVVQIVRKPTELFFPVSGTLNKAPAETWRQYEPLFREHSTGVITPELLAALALVQLALHARRAEPRDRAHVGAARSPGRRHARAPADRDRDAATETGSRRRDSPVRRRGRQRLCQARLSAQRRRAVRRSRRPLVPRAGRRDEAGVRAAVGHRLSRGPGLIA